MNLPRSLSVSALLISAVTSGIILSGGQAKALVFQQQSITTYESPGVVAETFLLDLTTENSPTTITKSGFTNPGVIRPGGGAPDPGNPLLTSQPYTFIGYRITGITGKVFKGGVHTGDIRFNPLGTTETGGVFNYPFGSPPSSPIDLISHGEPDNLWNPGGLGYGFSSTPSALGFQDNVVSYGGIAFDVLKAGTQVFDEPYQLFTVGQAPASGLFTSLPPGDYAGCPGSCVGAKVPAPLPILGAPIAFGFMRKLRKSSKLLHTTL
jgi:hypothetical protein